MRSVIVDIDGWRPWRWRVTATRRVYDELDAMKALVARMRRDRLDNIKALSAMMKRHDDEMAKLKTENDRLSRALHTSAYRPAHVGMP